MALAVRGGDVDSHRSRLTPDSAAPRCDRYEARYARRSIRSRWAWRSQPVRSDALAASRGATDFGAYFVYFSFFLVVSALLLASLFFKLGVEQRAREVGLLRAVGFGAADVRRLFMTEGLVVAVAGSAIGVAGAIAYAASADDRPAHLVGRCRGDDGADAARDVRCR